METLLSLTSKRAGDWFKEELRLLGGLDHIVDKGGCWVLMCSKPCCTVHMCIPMQRFCLSRFVIATCRVCCIATVKECVDNLSQEDDKENLVASLWGAERCLRVLESVSTVLSSWILSCTKVTLE